MKKIKKHVKNHQGLIVLSGIGIVGLAGAFAFMASAATDCMFTDQGNTRMLDADCATDATIFIPDGFTLDGRHHTITAVDPTGDHFKGAVVQNAGANAHVKNLVVTTSNLSNACDAGGDRLRGIMFQGASGSIVHNTVYNLNQGASGCQEGNAIEVRNEPFDGTHPDTQTVEIAHNGLTSWQKTGIVANGDVSVDIHHNYVGSSATQPNDLAANSIQLGFGAIGQVVQNRLDGNQWCGSSEFVATAILLFQTSNGAVVKQNIIGGNSDVGIYGFGDDLVVDNNKLTDNTVEDCNQFAYDIGIGNYGSATSLSSFTNNKVNGFDTPYDGVTSGKNKVIPGPQKGQTFF